jgi:mono/diheme cytochrome c family protein
MSVVRRQGSALLLVLAAGACARGEGNPTPPLQALHQRPLTGVRFEPTPERLARGEYLATAAIGCVLCHSERDRDRPGAPPVAGREFAGAVLSEEPGYRLVAPNLTPDVETGAGSWSDDQLARAIREGVGHDGRGLGGQMWWWAFRALADEDLASIVVYLRALPPVRHPLPQRLLSPERERRRAEQAQPLESPVPARDLSDPIARGRYLIEIADCMGCHSAWEAPSNPGLGAGGNAVERGGEKIFSANLSPDPSGIGGYTEEIFVGVLRNGRGGTIHPVMPWVAYGRMTDEDLRAIYRALRLLPPVAHRVHAAAPPTPCPACGQQHGLGELNTRPALERVAVDLGPLEAYAGSYRFGIDDLEVAAHDGRLWITGFAEADIELVPVAGDRLRGIGFPFPVSFERDADGAVTKLVTWELGPTLWERAP